MDRRKYRKMAFLVTPFVASLLVLLAISNSLSGTATLTWSPNADADLAGYRFDSGADGWTMQKNLAKVAVTR